MNYRADPILTVRGLKSAAPYIRMFKGKTFVIKAGGGAFGELESARALIEQIAILHQVGIRVVLVHGGGPQVTEMAEALGLQTRMVQGRRITDEKSIEVTTMVLNGLINTRIVALCRDFDVDAVGITGVDASLIQAHKRPPVQIPGEPQPVDFGYVGDIDVVDAAVLRQQLEHGLVPVVSPVSADTSGQVLNINADTVAAAIGSALEAEKLILCTGVPGILERLEDPTSIISYTDLAGLNGLRASGSLRDGMLPKANAIESAIRGGVRRVHVISYKLPDALLAEVFTNEGTGTLIVEDTSALSAAEQA